jgi:phosphatidylserine decarboxylase
MPPVAREGWVIVLIFVVLAGGATALALLAGPVAAAVVGGGGMLLCLWCVWFFRDPQRAIPDAPGVVVSAADGVVMRIEPCPPPEELGIDPGAAKGMTRVVVFLNVFNVHVNRAPVAGIVKTVAAKSGGFAHAGKPDADKNERSSVWIALPDARPVVVTQLTGWIARRIINRAKEGQPLRTGERYGLIRFGSRTDVYLPPGFEILVKPGDSVQGGATILAIDRSLTR